MLNEVRLLGYVGADPELHDRNGFKIAHLSVATTKRWLDKDGNKKESTQWHRVTLFNALADRVAKYVHKGSLIYVLAELRYESYEREGQKVYTTEIVASDIRFLDRKPVGTEQAALPDDNAPISFDDLESLG